MLTNVSQSKKIIKRQGDIGTYEQTRCGTQQCVVVKEIGQQGLKAHSYTAEVCLCSKLKVWNYCLIFHVNFILLY